jgi:hypothetical protein
LENGAATPVIGRARARARERARLDRYGYPDRPLREPILRSIPDSSGKPAGVITRKSFGCMVLNAAQMFIADIDLPRNFDGQPPRPGILERLFGAGGRAEVEPERHLRLAAAMRKVRGAVGGLSGGLALIYQTAAACPKSNLFLPCMTSFRAPTAAICAA